MRRFAYQKNRPYIPIVLRYGYKKSWAAPLLDTGADVTILHKVDAIVLGLNWEEGVDRSFDNADGSSFQVKEFRIEIEISGVRFPARVCFSDMMGFEKRLLGRADVFRRFLITICERDGYVEFCKH